MSEQKLNLSLPSKPKSSSTSSSPIVKSNTAKASGIRLGVLVTTSTSASGIELPPKPTFVLPPKPTTGTRTTIRRRSPSPLPLPLPPSSSIRSFRSGDVYIPSSRTRSPSPPPYPRRYTRRRSTASPDIYIPKDWPSPKRIDLDRREKEDYHHHHHQKTSYRHSRYRSPSPSSSRIRSTSISLSLSPRRRPVSPSPPPSPPPSHLQSNHRTYSTSTRTSDRDHSGFKAGNNLKDRLGGFFQSIETTTSTTNKRPASPPPTSIQPPIKIAKPIPTGPRNSSVKQAITVNISTIPTGPRADRYPQPPPTQTQNIPETVDVDGDGEGYSTSNSDSDMPGPSRRPNGNGRGPRRNGNGTSSTATSSLKQLALPIHDQNQITLDYGQGVIIKPQWAENPKAPLANFLGGGRGGADMNSEFQVQEGLAGSKKIFRVTVLADPARNIIGVGDHVNRKEAEKLAALSAVLQLTAAGILEKGKSGGKPSSGSTPNASAFVGSSSQPVSGGSSETAKLSDGSEISYDRARQFMEYYCQRYKFPKPDIEFSQSSSRSHKKGKHPSMTWDAVIAVGGKRIGMGQAASKKGAQIKCYLDVTQYLESCDPALWKDFLEYSKKDKSANLGMAPHLVFQMSDTLNEEVQGLCGDVRHSRLWENAPSSGAAAHEAHPAPAWSQGRQGQASAKELADKSLNLQNRLAEYQSDPKLDKMRKQRQSLPVFSRATEILTKIELNPVVIVMASTGSGKTTQVPQLLFDDYINRGGGAKCNIVCTQPRRLAAMSVAERIADERGQSLGKEVGYQVRFDVKLPQPNGSITFCTTGIFLKRMQSALGAAADPLAVERMDEVTHIVVDEVHERDIDTDLLLVVLKRLLADRQARMKPLKVVLMSATIDPTLFKNYFLDDRGRPAPVAEVPGRTFPVEKYYLDEVVAQLQGIPTNRGGWVFNDKKVADYLNKELSRDQSLFGPGTGMELEIPYPLVALTIADVMNRSEDGHVLVFLPGWDEIKKVADILLDSSKYPLMGMNFGDTRKFSIHYLHSTIPAAEQKEVFRPPPSGVRRIILATNIAETSITIPDVVYVVDTARVKEKRYDPDRHMSSLVSAWVGSSNLNQRAGRAGRHREGEYYGLLSKNRLAALDPHQMVEMKRSDLSNVVMHVKALNLGEVEEVLAATIEPPEPSRIVAAMEVLRMLGALDVQQNLTSLGRVLLQLPVEAAIGKLCLYGSFFRCLDSALTLAAVLTNRDPFVCPIEKKKQADEIKDSWSPLAFRSDPLAIVSAYNQWSTMDDRGDYRSANQFCSDNFLSKPTMLQIKQVKSSLLQSLEQTGVLAVSAGGQVNMRNGHGRGRGKITTVPPLLNQHGNSLPLLAALIAMASAPNFAIRTSEKTCRTSQDKVVFIHASSVNSRRREVGGPEEASASFNPAEKRLYAFGEKQRNVPPGGNPSSALTQLRVVTRLDPMTYMLFGAYELVVTQRGLECDNWLPVIGNLHALDDVQRLKVLLEGCMLRVFEGVGKSLMKGRDERWKKTSQSVKVSNGTSRINDDESDGEGGDEIENESDDEDEDENEDNKQKRIIEPLSSDEVKELELLTTDIVKILDSYAAEREGGSLNPTRPHTPFQASAGFTPAPAPAPASESGAGAGAGGQGVSLSLGAAGAGGGKGVYRPPQAQGRRRY